MTAQFHHQAIFGNSALSAGREVENLRLRRAGLQRDHRGVLLELEEAILGHAAASEASVAADGRELASLGEPDDAKRAANRRRTAETKRDKVAARAAALLAAVGACETEMTLILNANRTALVEERTVAYDAAYDAVGAAGEALRAALALLRLEALGVAVLLAAVGEDTSRAPDAQAITQLSRATAALLANIPDRRGGVSAIAA